MFKMASYIPHFIRKCVTYKNSKHSSLKYIGMLVNSRKYSSALIGSSDSGEEKFLFVVPYLDFDHRLVDVEKLQQELTARGLNLSAKDFESIWEFYKSIKANKSRLELQSGEIFDELNSLFKNKELTEKEQMKMTKLRLQIGVIKQDLKMVKKALQDLNNSILEKMLLLPNELDAKTPVKTPVILKRVNSLDESSDSEKKNHIEIGRRLGLLEYKNPMEYYLCNDAALFELGVLNYAGTIFSGDNMIRVAGADFSRSVIIDGSGLNHEDPSDAFIIDSYTDVEKNSSHHMHLVGGASLMSFLAMHTKQLINSNHFPVAYFSTGRQYTPFRPGSTPIGLFTVCQTSAALAFIFVKDQNSQEYQTQFERLLNNTCKLYDNICDHYQIVLRSASELRPWETMRVSFELWSSFSKQYIEVGHISMCGEYFSKRLFIAYRTQDGKGFPSVISGTVLSVPRLLGCLLEQNPDKFVIPPKVLEYITTDYTSH